MPTHSLPRHQVTAVFEEGFFADKDIFSFQPIGFETKKSALAFVCNHHQQRDANLESFNRNIGKFMMTPEEEMKHQKKLQEHFQSVSADLSNENILPEKLNKNLHVKKGNSFPKGLDAKSVEAIATDILEYPSASNAYFIKKWKVSNPTIRRIRTGEHRNLRPQLVTALKIQLKGNTKERTVAARKQLPQHIVSEQSDLKPENSKRVVSPINSQRKIPVLTELINMMRQLMHAENIERISIPLKGDVIIMKKEIFKL